MTGGWCDECEDSWFDVVPNAVNGGKLSGRPLCSMCEDRVNVCSFCRSGNEVRAASMTPSPPAPHEFQERDIVLLRGLTQKVEFNERMGQVKKLLPNGRVAVIIDDEVVSVQSKNLLFLM